MRYSGYVWLVATLAGCQGFYSARGDGDAANRIDAKPVPMCPNVATDSDCDDQSNDKDNCPLVANPLQEDEDRDRAGDACDNCIGLPNPGPQVDEDGDNIGEACDPQPDKPNSAQAFLTSSVTTSMWEQVPKNTPPWDVKPQESKSVLSQYGHLLQKVDVSGHDFTALEIGFNVGEVDPMATSSFVGVVIGNNQLNNTGVYCEFARGSGSFGLQLRENSIVSSATTTFDLQPKDLLILRLELRKMTSGYGASCSSFVPAAPAFTVDVPQADVLNFGELGGIFASNRMATLRYMVVYH